MGERQSRDSLLGLMVNRKQTLVPDVLRLIGLWHCCTMTMDKLVLKKPPLYLFFFVFTSARSIMGFFRIFWWDPGLTKVVFVRAGSVPRDSYAGIVSRSAVFAAGVSTETQLSLMSTRRSQRNSLSVSLWIDCGLMLWCFSVFRDFLKVASQTCCHMALVCCIFKTKQ